MKNDKPRVSIIIPVYNTEKFLKRCIESVLNQSYTNIEIILINDGSTDTSGEICDEFAKKDDRIITIHQKNQGVSSARNTGLKYSTGQYIQFIDSDDSVNINMTNLLVHSIIKNKCDIAVCGYSTIGKEKKDVVYPSSLFERNEFLIASYINQTVSPLIWGSCNMIFKKQIIDDNSISFNHKYFMGEDGLFTLRYLEYCNKVYIIGESLYNYYQYIPEERISAMSHLSTDVYELRINYFSELFRILHLEIGERHKAELYQAFFDKVIAGLVRLGAYSEFYSKSEMLNRLKHVVNNELIILAVKKYKRKRKNDSIIIPWLVRFQLVNLLNFSLKIKGEKYIEKYGKRSFISSIYKNN